MRHWSQRSSPHDASSAQLKAACRLVATERCAAPGPARGAYQSAGAILVVWLGCREPQHREVTRLHFHSLAMTTCAEDAVQARQTVAGHVKQQMMFEVIVHIIRRDKQPLQKARVRRPRVPQRIA